LFYKTLNISQNFLIEILKEYNSKKPQIIKAHKFVLDNLDKNIFKLKEKLGKNYHIYSTDKNFIIKDTTFKYDKNFSLAFAKDYFLSHNIR